MQLNKTINPFVNGLTVPYKEFVTKLAPAEAGVQAFGFKVETTQHFRVYTSKARREFLFRELSVHARDLLSALQHFCNPDYKYVILTLKKMQDLCNVPLSKRRFDDTIRELVRKSIIDYKDKTAGEFWYNPAYFAAGNRLEMFPECAVKVSSQYIGDNRQLLANH